MAFDEQRNVLAHRPTVVASVDLTDDPPHRHRVEYRKPIDEAIDQLLDEAPFGRA